MIEKYVIQYAFSQKNVIYDDAEIQKVVKELTNSAYNFFSNIHFLFMTLLNDSRFQSLSILLIRFEIIWLINLDM